MSNLEISVSDYTDTAYWVRWYTGGSKLIWHRLDERAPSRFPKTLCGRFIPDASIQFGGHVPLSQECVHCLRVYTAKVKSHETK
jgi:hypothetical protein